MCVLWKNKLVIDLHSFLFQMKTTLQWREISHHCLSLSLLPFYKVPHALTTSLSRLSVHPWIFANANPNLIIPCQTAVDLLSFPLSAPIPYFLLKLSLPLVFLTTQLLFILPTRAPCCNTPAKMIYIVSLHYLCLHQTIFQRPPGMKLRLPRKENTSQNECFIWRKAQVFYPFWPDMRGIL